MSSVRARRGEETPGWLRGQQVPRWLRVLPVALLLVLGFADMLTPSHFRLGFFLTVLPPLAALMHGPLVTALLGVGVLVVASPLTPGWQAARGDVLPLVIAAAISVLLAWIRSRRDAQLVHIGTVAEVSQLAVLPPLPALVGGVRCAGRYRAAHRGALVSGDLYDVRQGPWGVRAVVADVEGHDLAAVSTVSALLGAFREAVLDDPDLAAVAARLDRRLVVDSAAVEHAELFATAVLLEFPADGKTVHVVSCGHPPPLLLRDGTATELSLDPAPPLGLGLADLAAPSVTVLPLRPGDRLLAHTDGVTEARDARGDFYPLAARLSTMVTTAPAPEEELGALAETVLADLARFAHGGVEDDVALLLLEPGND
ncbi:PP2C family protein-serine/threonine phosphatase [Streptomyces sp. CA-294286]|uniref:PP2C family protein-serine/threonine phosphatase n=1 Tax=Streptomyces sp. CA-294286 TaxID=3240070 RepID=UPI003D8D51EE